MKRSYWLDLFTWKTWEEFLEAGAKVTGFREKMRGKVQQIKSGDYLLCYLIGVSRFIGVLEAKSSHFKDSTPIWKNDDFPHRIRVAQVVKLTPETAIPITELRDSLTIFQNLKSPNAWTGRVRASPVKWVDADGEAITKALLEAEKNPVVRPVDASKLSRRPKALKAKIGSVTVPTEEEAVEDTSTTPDAVSLHTEIQWLLLKLGNDMGLDLWVARNDRGREVNGKKFAEIPHTKSELPLQFDEATNRTIELIDVLWIKGNAIVAAFEIESTTSIYSGLLRMSDLIAMQPNLNIPLYLVAPDSRREKVISEVNRPTFLRLSPPMSEMCRFIPFSNLKEGISRIAPVARYLKPEFLEEISESCEVEEV